MRSVVSALLLAVLLPRFAATLDTLQLQQVESNPKLLTALSSQSQLRTDQLLVTLLDGRLVAVDSDTGEINWTLDLGRPLISGSGTWHTELPGAKKALSRTILPGADGSLYIFTDAAGSQQDFERLPTSVPKLVSASPSATADGTVLLGSHHSSVYIVDSQTGTLLGILPPDADDVDPQDQAGQLLPVQQDLSHALILGRSDFTVQSVDAVAGQQKWNVTYAQLEVLTPAHTPFAAAAAPEVATANPVSGLVGISASADNTLQRRHPQTGVGLWTLQLGAPPVAVHLADGSSLNLYADSALDSNDSMVVVGMLQDSLYALPVPAEWLRSRLPGSMQDGLLQHGDRSDSQRLMLSGPEADRQRKHGRVEQDKRVATGNSQALVPLPGVDTEGSSCAWQSAVSLHSVVPTSLPQSFLPSLADADLAPAQRSSQADDMTATGNLMSSTMSMALLALTAFISAVLLLLRRRILAMRASKASREAEKSAAAAAAANFGGSLPERKADVQAPAVALSQDIKSSNHSKKAQPQVNAQHRKGRRKQQSRWHAQQQAEAAKTFQAADGNHHTAKAALKHEDPTTGMTQQGDQEEEQPDQPSPQGQERPTKRRTVMTDGTVVIGHLQVGPSVIGYGSQGTVVFEGSLHGRPVAVKRMMGHLYHIAKLEIDALIASDEHACIVRCFALEEDEEFVYLALERCKQTLAQMMTAGASQQEQLVDEAGYPTAWCMQVVEDIGLGLQGLHERGIVHRDVKPHNVLLTGQGRAKVSDMGHCKRLPQLQTSFETPGSGGSSGWQSPEQLIARSGGNARQSYATDVFSYAMLAHFCLTNGKHPFGQHYERDFNILQARTNLKALAHLPEAQGLIQAMLRADPGHRPSMRAVMEQPFWWSPARRLAFLIHLSDRVELSDREADQSLLQELEAVSQQAIGQQSWADALSPAMLANLGKYRKYSGSSLRDLLRVIRNKHNHFRELPTALQEEIGALPEAFLRYFTSKFPHLLQVTYQFACSHCSQDPPLSTYFHARGSSLTPPAQQSFLFTDAAVAVTVDTTAPPAARVDAITAGQQLAEPQNSPSTVKKPGHSQATVDAAVASLGAAAAVASASKPRPEQSVSGRVVPLHDSSAATSAPHSAHDTSLHTPSSQASAALPTARPLQADDRSTMVTETMPNQQRSVSSANQASHQPLYQDSVNSHMASNRQVPLNGYEMHRQHPAAASCLESRSLHCEHQPAAEQFPQRPGQTTCTFYAKTGYCKFGQTCKFDHPVGYAVRLNRLGLPLRHQEQICPFYMKTGECKYGPSCKFHHPEPPQVWPLPV